MNYYDIKIKTPRDIAKLIREACKRAPVDFSEDKKLFSSRIVIHPVSHDHRRKIMHQLELLQREYVSKIITFC